MMDPRDQDEGSNLPLNLEAEQALLGILLFSNEAHRQVHDLVTAEDFSEPYHQRIYALVGRLITAGKLAEPATIQNDLAPDPAFEHFGGLPYLRRLWDAAPPANTIRAYAEQIADTAVRRRLIKMATETLTSARDTEHSGYSAVAKARAELEEAERGAAPEDALFVNAWDAAQARMDRLELEVATGKPKGVQTGLSSIDSYIRLGAQQIGFGDNTVFDDATDTLQTVINGRRRVLALGAPFGQGGNLIEWWGPSNISLGSMTTGNGDNGRMTASPYVFDNTLASAFSASTDTGFIGGARNGAGPVQTSNSVTVTVSGGTAGATIRWVRLSGDSRINMNDPTAFTTGAYATIGVGEVISAYFMGAVTKSGKSAVVYVQVDLSDNGT